MLHENNTTHNKSLCYYQNKVSILSDHQKYLSVSWLILCLYIKVFLYL